MGQLAINVPTQLILNLDEDGKFSMAGPLDNKLLCYGLLEMAREAIQRRQPTRIVRPDFPPLSNPVPKF